jgi:hypothetical protein
LLAKEICPSRGFNCSIGKNFVNIKLAPVEIGVVIFVVVLKKGGKASRILVEELISMLILN